MDAFAPILGMTMMVIGLLLFMVSVGRLLWVLARHDAPSPPQEPAATPSAAPAPAPADRQSGTAAYE